jgi:hypothetical protein
MALHGSVRTLRMCHFGLPTVPSTLEQQVKQTTEDGANKTSTVMMSHTARNYQAAGKRLAYKQMLIHNKPLICGEYLFLCTFGYCVKLVQDTL